MEITLEWLEEQCACDEQRLDFEEEFGAYAIVTRETFDRALEIGLDLDWLASDTDLLEEDEAAAYDAYEKRLWEEQEKRNFELTENIVEGHIDKETARLEQRDHWVVYDRKLAMKLLEILEARE